MTRDFSPPPERELPGLPSRTRPSTRKNADQVNREIAGAEEEARTRGGTRTREEHEREASAFMAALRAKSQSKPSS